MLLSPTSTPMVFYNSSSKINRSHSKFPAFLYRHMHHIKQWGIAFEIVLFLHLPTWPFQQASKSAKSLGITEWTLKNSPKTISHSSLTKEQAKANEGLSPRLSYMYNKNWPNNISPPLIMHSQNSPKRCSPNKEGEETLVFQMLFHGNFTGPPGTRAL